MKRLLLALLGLVVTCAVGARIWWVNESMPRIPVETYGAGEWVALDGAFQELANEQTKGYSLRVDSAKVVSYDEYLRAHGVEPAEPSKFGDAKSVVDVAISVRRDASSSGDGGLNMFDMVLVPARKNEYFMVSIGGGEEGCALWPQVQKNAGFWVSIRPGTEYTMHVPYVINSSGARIFKNPIEDRDFELVASRMPVQKLIRFSAQ